MALKKSELYSSLWASCDELRGGMDASQYKDYVLVMLFVKYISDKYAGVPKPAYINQHIALVRFDQSKISAKFVAYYLASPGSQRRFRALTDAGAKAGMNLTTIQRVEVAAPRRVAEQRTIGDALTDADALIESLEQLLAKKRLIREGALQGLLTGARRLNGFREEWTVRRLGEICEINMGRTPPRLNSSYWGRGYTWLSIADLKSKVVSDSKEQITPLAAADMQVVPRGTLLMSFKLSVGRLCFAGSDLYTNEAICSFRSLRADANFLYYALGRTDFSLYGKQAVKGFTLNKESLALVEISMPDELEQAAIASSLSDIDFDIDATLARLAKARQIRQGMMENLLTGKIRLV